MANVINMWAERKNIFSNERLPMSSCRTIKPIYPLISIADSTSWHEKCAKPLFVTYDQGSKIDCIMENTFNQGWLSETQLRALAQALSNNSYKVHLNSQLELK